ncbi:hypothetical protein Tco_0174421 [Tanacetum coccineum]
MVAYLKKPEGSEEFHKIVNFLNASHIRHIQLANADGISSVSTTKFFEQLSLMGGLVVQGEGSTHPGEGSTVPVESHHTPTGTPSTSQPHLSSTLRSSIKQETKVPQPSSPTQTHVAAEVASTSVDVRHGGAATTVTGLEAGQGSDRVVALETDLKQTKIVYGAAYTKLIMKVHGRHEHDMEPDFEFTTAEEVYTAEKGVSTVEPVSTAGASVSTASASSAKDNGKAIMEEAETIQIKTKLQLEQERLSYEEALRLQAEIDNEERQRIVRVQEQASSFNIEKWDDIQARVEADEEFLQRLQSEERKMYSEAEKARLLAELINERKRYFAISTKEAAIKGGTEPYTSLNRGLTSVTTASVVSTASPTKVSTVDDINLAEILEIYTEGTRKYWKIIKVGNHTEVHQFFNDMLKALDRDDLVMLWCLVKENFKSTEPTDDKEREIWVELKRLFESDTDDELWKLQKHIHDLTWKLYDLCGVHHVYTEERIDIYMLVEKEYPLSRGTLTLMVVAKLLVDQDNEMSRELLRKIFMQVERPRR